MNEKKVVAVIVEGPSDENALGGILKEFFSSEEVQFAVVHGDITSDKNTTTDNVLKRIDKLIDGLRSRYGYQWDDFIRIIHIADTDGTFTKDCVMESDNDAVRYHEDFIEAPNVEALIKRNECKAQIMLKLHSTGKVHGIKYRLFYNSCNLEHVLYNELKDFSDEEKEALSDDFKAYAKQIILNAKALAKSLMDEGLDIVGGGTDNHLMTLDLRKVNKTGKDIANLLELVGITANYHIDGNYQL